MRLGALALAASIALIAAGCGDDETTSSSSPIAPATSSTTSSTSTTRSTTTTESTTTTQPSYDPDKPDTEKNDKPPEAGSPQESFEQACEQNPESCG